MSLAPDDPFPSAQDDPEAEHLPLTDLESSSASPPSPRKRAAQIALAALAVIVASAVVWNSIGPGRHPPPQPSAPLTKISALLVSNVTNATVTLNRKQLAGHLPMVVSAYLETDQITVSAPLFHPHTCQFKGLLTKTDTVHCLFTIDNLDTQTGVSFVIGAFLTPKDLSPTQQSQVTNPILKQLAVAQQTTVQPGDYVPTSFANTAVAVTSQRAAAPLQASATLVQGPPLSSTSFGPYLASCAQLICPWGFGPSHPAPAGQVWGGLLNVMLRWHFTTSTGTPIADVTYTPSPLTGFRPSLPEVQFVDDGTGWNLAADTDLNTAVQAAICYTGWAILDERLLDINTGYSGTNTSHISAAGCQISVQSTTKGTGSFLWRFGVLLAANANAHTLLPDLPVASQAELAAASR
jgi:hypothetical protein